MLVLYCSIDGRAESLAHAAAMGAAAAGAEATVKRAPGPGGRAELADAGELAAFDAVLLAVPGQAGGAVPMRAFLDRAAAAPGRPPAGKPAAILMPPVPPDARDVALRALLPALQRLGYEVVGMPGSSADRQPAAVERSAARLQAAHLAAAAGALGR